jgi:hypothetical protein
MPEDPRGLSDEPPMDGEFPNEAEDDEMETV